MGATFSTGSSHSKEQNPTKKSMVLRAPENQEGLRAERTMSPLSGDSLRVQGQLLGTPERMEQQGEPDWAGHFMPLMNL